MACCAEFGREAKKYIDHGHLVPDDLITHLMIDELRKIEHESWLLDGTQNMIIINCSVDFSLDVLSVITISENIFLCLIKKKKWY